MTSIAPILEPIQDKIYWNSRDLLTIHELSYLLFDAKPYPYELHVTLVSKFEKYYPRKLTSAEHKDSLNKFVEFMREYCKVAVHAKSLPIEPTEQTHIAWYHQEYKENIASLGYDMTIDFNRIRDALSFVPATDREIWVRMGMAVKSELGESGFELWDTWSQQANSYNTRDAKDVWKSIRPDGEVTLGTLYYEAKSNGWSVNKPHHALDPIEVSKHRQDIAERATSKEKGLAEEQAKTAAKAQEIWNNAIEVNANHPYLSGVN